MAGDEGTSALEIATAIVAIYAAVVASLALAFNIFSWLRTWQTRLQVRLRRMQITTPGTGPGEPVVMFDLTNQSGHRVKVTHVGMSPIKRGGPHLFFPHPLGLVVPGAFEVPARDSVTVWIEPDKLSDGDPHHKTRARIQTSDGRSFKSKRVRVQDLLEDR